MNGEKIVLVSGGTDGIGRATAISLAQKGYSVHIIGRNPIKGEVVLKELKKINTKGNHKIFLFDLGEIDECLAFCKNYKSTHTKLDLLILNANIAPKKPTMNTQGWDSLFMIGYISRYILSSQFEELLEKADSGRIVHINTKTDNYRKRFEFDTLKNPKYTILKSINQCYVASTHMVLNNQQLGYSNIPAMIFDPGPVLTNQILDRGYLFTLLSRVFNAKKPQVVGDIAANQIIEFSKSNEPIRICYREKIKKVKQPLEIEVENYQELVQFSQRLTGITYTLE